MTASTEFALVRHGETDWNRAHRIQGRTDIPLNDTGRAQAARAGEILARRPWTAVVTSPLDRALETARIVAEVAGLPDPKPEAAFVERDYGAAEGLGFSEVEQRFPGDAVVPGRESRDEVRSRVVPALLRLAKDHRGGALIVVSHGGVIRSVLEHAQPGVRWGRITNGSIHRFRVEGDGVHLIAFDDDLERDSLVPGAEDVDDQNALEARDDGASPSNPVGSPPLAGARDREPRPTRSN